MVGVLLPQFLPFLLFFNVIGLVTNDSPQVVQNSPSQVQSLSQKKFPIHEHGNSWSQEANLWNGSSRQNGSQSLSSGSLLSSLKSCIKGRQRPNSFMTSATGGSDYTSTTNEECASSVLPSSLPAILPKLVPGESPASPITENGPDICGTWNGQDDCNGNGDTKNWEFPASAENRRWQTPPQGAPDYSSSFKTYSDLVAYADIQYNCSRTTAVVVVNAASKSSEAITYSFNGEAFTSSNTYQVGSAFQKSLTITVETQRGKSLVLEPINFIWQNVPLTAAQSSFLNGQKGAVAELYGWPWNDIAKECDFLGKAGYMGVKIWPPNEHVWGSNAYETDGQFRPWWLVYQPVSYRLQSRSGTRSELRNMIQTCRKSGVRVYADAVINHMAADSKSPQPHRKWDCSTYPPHNSTLGSPYFTPANTYLLNPYTGTRPTVEFPAVPYGPTDFHCVNYIQSYLNPDQVTRGWLVSLADLNTEKPYVQDRIATYLVDLLSIGFSGFRIDAAKHIGPASLARILARVKAKLGNSLPSDFLTWLEVLVNIEEAPHLVCDGDSHSWYTNFDTQLSMHSFTKDEIHQIKIWGADYPADMPICGQWILDPSRFAIQNDDHDQQSHGSTGRDMGDKGSVLIVEKDIVKHRKFEVQLFERRDQDWWIKLVLSSYMFMEGGGNGFPDGLSDCALYTGNQDIKGCKGVVKDLAFMEGACGYEMGNGKFTRVHRDLKIVNAMRRWAGLGEVKATELGLDHCEQ